MDKDTAISLITESLKSLTKRDAYEVLDAFYSNHNEVRKADNVERWRVMQKNARARGFSLKELGLNPPGAIRPKVDSE